MATTTAMPAPSLLLPTWSPVLLLLSIMPPAQSQQRAAGGTADVASTNMHLRLDLLAANSGSGSLPMLDISSAAISPTLTWELPVGVVAQTHAVISVERVLNSGAVLYTTAVSGADQNVSLAVAHLLQPATVYTVTVTTEGTNSSGAAVTQVSTPLAFFTSLADTWEARPIWASPCSAGTRAGPPWFNNTTPDYAWFRSSLALPVGEEVVSALAFVSAEAPLSVENPEVTRAFKWGLDRGSKILGAYKLFIDGAVVGVGPGRPRCAAVSQGDCERQTPYDGFALTVSPGATDIAVEIHAYGRDQPSINLTQRVIFQLVVRTKTGKVLQLASSDTW